MRNDAPEVWAAMEKASESCAARMRDALERARGLGLDPSDLTRTERSLPRLDEVATLEAAGADPDALAHAAPEVWELLARRAAALAARIGESDDDASGDLSIVATVTEAEACALARLEREGETPASAPARGYEERAGLRERRWWAGPEAAGGCGRFGRCRLQNSLWRA